MLHKSINITSYFFDVNFLTLWWSSTSFYFIAYTLWNSIWWLTGSYIYSAFLISITTQSSYRDISTHSPTGNRGHFTPDQPVTLTLFNNLGFSFLPILTSYPSSTTLPLSQRCPEMSMLFKAEWNPPKQPCENCAMKNTNKVGHPSVWECMFSYYSCCLHFYELYQQIYTFMHHNFRFFYFPQMQDMDMWTCGCRSWRWWWRWSWTTAPSTALQRNCCLRGVEVSLQWALPMSQRLCQAAGQ